MKRFCSFLLLIAMLFGNLSSAFAYFDVGADYNWAQESISALSENGTLNGYPDGTFLPQNNVTKAELSKMLVLLFGEGKEASYTDVAEKDWFYQYVSKTGNYFRDSDTFFPNQAATREEVAYGVFMAMGITDAAMDRMISFSDQKEVDTTCLAAVKFLHRNSVITGYPDGTFRPKTTITRAETAVILHRAYQLVTTVATPSPTPLATPEATDLQSNNYFFLVQKVSTVLKDGEPVTKVVGYNNGVLEELFLDDSVNIIPGILATSATIRPGDVIGYMRDFFDNIISVSLGVNLAELPQNYSIYLLNPGNTNKRQILYGIVEKRYQEKGIEITSTNSQTQFLYSLASTVNVYQWKNGKLALSDLYEITDSTYETGDKIIAYCYDEEISDIVIIKE